MPQSIRLDGLFYEIESLELQNAIAASKDIRANRPHCVCKEPPIEMYVARTEGKYIVKRMPDTGHLHDPGCASYEAPGAISGVADVDGKAIIHDDDNDTVTLKLGFSLSKSNASHTLTQSPAPSESAKAGNSKLTMRSVMDYLWNEAQLNRWHPSMSGKRNYNVVYKFVRRAAMYTNAKRMALAEALYMPEPFFVHSDLEIRERASTALMRCAHQRTGTQPLMLLFGEVKEFVDARQGQQVVIKHAPFVNFYMNHALREKVRRMFESELTLWDAQPSAHLMMLGSFSQNSAGIYELSEVSLMVVDEGWIPVKDLPEMQLYARLALSNRAFMRGLRFNIGKDVRLAEALLTDTDPPVALYLTTGSEPYHEIDDLEKECDSADLVAIFMRTTEVETMALTPARPGRRPIPAPAANKAGVPG